MYSTISQSTIITSPIGFNIALTNVDARLKQRCINVVPTLCNVVLTLCNVVSTLFQRQAVTLHQGCATFKIRHRILFNFQRRINVISTVIHNVETTLIQRWNVGLDVSPKFSWLDYFKVYQLSHIHYLSVRRPSRKTTVVLFQLTWATQRNDSI